MWCMIDFLHYFSVQVVRRLFRLKCFVILYGRLFRYLCVSHIILYKTWAFYFDWIQKRNIEKKHIFRKFKAAAIVFKQMSKFINFVDRNYNSLIADLRFNDARINIFWGKLFLLIYWDSTFSKKILFLIYNTETKFICIF